MRYLVVITILTVESSVFAGVGANIGASYNMENVSGLIPDYGFNEPTDVKLSGLKFHLELPINFVDTPNMSIYIAPSLGYMSLKSATYGVPAAGSTVVSEDHTYSSVPVGASLGADLKFGSLFAGGGLFYEMDMSAKHSRKVGGENTASSKAKASSIGLKIDAGINLHPMVSLEGFVNYAFSRNLEITSPVDNIASKYKASQLGFGAGLKIAFGGQATPRPKGAKKSKRIKNNTSEINSSEGSADDEQVPVTKPIKNKKMNLKKPKE